MSYPNLRTLNVASLDHSPSVSGGCIHCNHTIPGYARPERQATTMAITIDIEDMADNAYSSKPSLRRT
jgi:hypothetical protein